MAFKPSTLSGPDGSWRLEGSFYPTPSNSSEYAQDYVQIIAHSNGKMVYSSLWLSFFFHTNDTVGSELRVESFSFGLPLSSNSEDHTNSFTGKMVLKEKTEKRVVISMEDIHMKINHGDYTLNGYLIAKTKE